LCEKKLERVKLELERTKILLQYTSNNKLKQNHIIIKDCENKWKECEDNFKITNDLKWNLKWTKTRTYI